MPFSVQLLHLKTKEKSPASGKDANNLGENKEEREIHEKKLPENLPGNPTFPSRDLPGLWWFSMFKTSDILKEKCLEIATITPPLVYGTELIANLMQN